MKYIADLHIHSRFSRATARNLNFPNLYLAARIKGITVLATGDCTHPGWFAEITEQLIPAEPGLFKMLSGETRGARAGYARRECDAVRGGAMPVSVRR